MNNFNFHNPTELLFGEGQVKKIGKKVKEYGNKVLVVTGGGSVKRIGLYDKVIALLQEKDLEIHELSGIEPNPRVSSVREGVKICRENDIDIVLAVGGGSTIDATKAIAGAAFYDGDPWDLFAKGIRIKNALPIGTILTLAATGSEMNPNFVISNLKTEEKMGASSPLLYPKFSILDPINTFTVPKEHTVYGIIDIAAHVYEQYFSHTESTPIQDRWAESILKTLKEESVKVLANPEDYDARSNIMLAGTMALNGLLSMGKETDWASHGIEHAVSAVYDIPHGGGLAIIFPNWMKYVLEEGTDKFVQYATRVWDVDPTGKSDHEIALEGIEKTREWFNEMGAPARLADYNIGDDKLELMAEKATAKGTRGSYKVLGKDDIVEIYKMSL
ncbi:butanol dehydrogenase [Orenia metallireducens]|uniref:Butanol dehydrogenase n=1 Tax=Orenia metallireducens TaxID=1413210 RepID=A0A1C0A5L9_9FIRM|nr:iron-containing alcohol dehydrogenase [Orenia metallireducens]OCL25442.1 butanol dehydrogenase [Orenia metallireducens]